MKTWVKTAMAAAVGVGVLGATSAYAVPMIGIEIFVDGVLDKSAPLTAGGLVTLSDTTNPYFSSISVTSTGAPATPDPNFGTITINAASNFTTGSHTLTLMATQVNLTGSGLGGLANTFTYNGLSNPSKITSSIGTNYVSASNTAYALTTKIANTPDEGGVTTYSSPVMTFTPSPPPLFSETEVYAFTFTGQALAQSSAQIIGVPEPVSLTVLGAGLVGLGLMRRRRA